MSLGQTIRTLRKRRGMDQKELADKLGLAQSTVCDWESGKTCPRHARLATLARVLNVSVKRLVA